MRAVVGLALVGALTLGCGAQERSAAGRFRPAHPGTLTVATAEIPTTGFWEGTPEHVTGGFEWALANALAGRWGLARVSVVTVAFAAMVGGDLGGADLGLAQLTATAGRERVLGFSTPYLPSTPAVLVRAGTDVPDLAAARQRSWAVQASTTLEAFLDDVVRPDLAPLQVGSSEESPRLLESGRVEAVLLDLPVAAALADRSGGVLEVAGQFATDDALSAALPKGSANREAVDSALRALEADGTIDTLVRESIGDTVVGSAAAPVIRTRR